MYEEIQIFWMVGCGLLICAVITLYLVLASEPVYREAAKIGCVICDDGSCVDCRERTAMLLKMRGLLRHTPGCIHRFTIGKAECDCGVDIV